MSAGTVVYRREKDSLVGTWCHENIGGAISREIVSGVVPGATEGEWPVEIYAPDDSLMYSGVLESERFGESLRWEWSGNFAADGSAGKFLGIGQIINQDLLAGTFEQV